MGLAIDDIMVELNLVIFCRSVPGVLVDSLCEIHQTFPTPLLPFMRLSMPLVSAPTSGYRKSKPPGAWSVVIYKNVMIVEYDVR